MLSDPSQKNSRLINSRRTSCSAEDQNAVDGGGDGSARLDSPDDLQDNELPAPPSDSLSPLTSDFPPLSEVLSFERTGLEEENTPFDLLNGTPGDRPSDRTDALMPWETEYGQRKGQEQGGIFGPSLIQGHVANPLAGGGNELTERPPAILLTLDNANTFDERPPPHSGDTLYGSLLGTLPTSEQEGSAQNTGSFTGVGLRQEKNSQQSPMFQEMNTTTENPPALQAQAASLSPASLMPSMSLINAMHGPETAETIRLPSLFQQLSQLSGHVQSYAKIGEAIPALNIHLEPQELGILDVHVEFKEETLFLVFKGEQGALDLLQQHVNRLVGSLREQGLPVEESSIAFDLPNPQHHDSPHAAPRDMWESFSPIRVKASKPTEDAPQSSPRSPRLLDLVIGSPF